MRAHRPIRTVAIVIAPLEKTAFNVVKAGDLFELEALLKGSRRQTLPQP